MDLNNIHEKKLVTKKLLLEHITDLDIYNMYMDGVPVVVNTSMLSPLRNENNTSFGFFIKNNELLFNDFVLGGGDCIRFVELLFNESHTQALARIVNDFNLNDYFIIANTKASKSKRRIIQNKEQLLESSAKFRLTKKRRKWYKHDIKFWNSFGIKFKTLKKFNVQPITHIFLSDKIIKTDIYSYCFIEKKDNHETYKIYQPFNSDFKWLTNHSDDVWQGWTQLPKNGKTLIITKSLKDVMAIHDCLEIPSISLQAESVKPKESVINELKERFDNIYLLYDNDFDKDKNWGQIFADKFCKEYSIQNLMIPSEYKAKDFSDLVKKYGRETSINILNNLINDIK